jgi:hypothetical protein
VALAGRIVREVATQNDLSGLSTEEIVRMTVALMVFEVVGSLAAITASFKVERV